MDRNTSTTIVIAVIVLALIGMFFGWRARKNRQKALPLPLPVPLSLGAELLSTEALYVATTIANEPLNRVTVKGLGFRARATVTVTASGVILSLNGERETFIPLADLRAVERATWTIDRVVEAGGLVLLAWTLGEADVDSYLRVDGAEGPDALIDSLVSLLETKAAAPTAPVPVPAEPAPLTTEGEQE
jgi:hypothetical protein